MQTAYTYIDLNFSYCITSSIKATNSKFYQTSNYHSEPFITLKWRHKSTEHMGDSNVCLAKQPFVHSEQPTFGPCKSSRLPWNAGHNTNTRYELRWTRQQHTGVHFYFVKTIWIHLFRSLCEPGIKLWVPGHKYIIFYSQRSIVNKPFWNNQQKLILIISQMKVFTPLMVTKNCMPALQTITSYYIQVECFKETIFYGGRQLCSNWMISLRIGCTILGI